MTRIEQHLQRRLLAAEAECERLRARLREADGEAEGNARGVDNLSASLIEAYERLRPHDPDYVNSRLNQYAGSPAPPAQDSGANPQPDPTVWIQPVEQE